MDCSHNITTFANIKALWENRCRETLNLEFKSDVTTQADDIAKDISSFANSEGGIIIYGVDEESEVARTSNGIDSKSEAVRIEQIVSSSISPGLSIETIVIDARDNNDKIISGREFIVVKIPKSVFCIHQVTTKAKFYFRNNTTTKSSKYAPHEMKEPDIALRYENRFRRKQDQIDFMKMKEDELMKVIPHEIYIFCGAMPQVKINAPIELKKDDFNRLLFKIPNNIYHEDRFNGKAVYPCFNLTDIFFHNLPKGNGRFFKSDDLYLEMNEDRSIFSVHSLPGIEAKDFIGSQTFVRISQIFVDIAAYLHMVNRYYSSINQYSGISIMIKLVHRIVNTHLLTKDKEVFEGRNILVYEVPNEIQIIPFDVKKVFSWTFDKICQYYHIDDALTTYVELIKRQEEVIDGWDSEFSS